jgi:hypothetical protein
MPLLLPGERHFRWIEVVVAVVVVLGLCALGCAAPAAQTRAIAPRFEAARFEAARLEAAPSGASSGAPRPASDEGASFVERALHDAGFRFGTDGSTRALWGYLRTAHQVVSAMEARPGDILFFDTRGTGSAPDCADRTGIVEKVRADGRITFVEARDGRIRRGFVDPSRPTTRRDGRGDILNSFLRPIRIDDPPGSRYFAGEGLCGVARTR